ncbi:astacin-like metalloendopeptidase [Paramacrobiotus metropolitanus]|uniref:astacin-like metalloendopeptidase n=1 Tax=Paramacrobiotus metropolitanus TaxID=2943436 RepID=UPI0024458ECE|nr:astacin-like metalloendopeptidase [Paramacrobiotus metropolitanus]
MIYHVYMHNSNDIPYALQGFNAHEQQILESNLQTIERLTSDCVRFRERRSEQEFIKIQRSTGFPAICQAGIGRHAGRPTPVRLHSQCLTPGIIQHEILHALGFLHEHSRPDRDEYISIVAGNMRSEIRESDYQKMPKMATFGLPYDTESIMHYGNEVSRSPDKPAIVSKRTPPPRWMGQDHGLSPLDMAKIRAAYNCSRMADVSRVTNQDASACSTCAIDADHEESEDFAVAERDLSFVFPVPSMEAIPFTDEQCERQFSAVCNSSWLHNKIGSDHRCDPQLPYYAVECHTATAPTTALLATFRRMALPPARMIELLLHDSLLLRGETLQPIRLQVMRLVVDDCHAPRMTGKLHGMSLSNMLTFEVRHCSRGLVIRRQDFNTSHKLRIIAFLNCVIQSVEADSFFYLLDLRVLTLERDTSPAEVKKQRCHPRFAWYRQWLSRHSYLIKDRERGGLYKMKPDAFHGLWSPQFTQTSLFRQDVRCD